MSEEFLCRCDFCSMVSHHKPFGVQGGGRGSKLGDKTVSVEVEARDIITNARRDAYGPVEEGFDRIAEIWSGILGIKVTGKQVALCMVGLKTYREANKHQRDNLVDIVGYTLLLDQLENPDSGMTEVPF